MTHNPQMRAPKRQRVRTVGFALRCISDGPLAALLATHPIPHFRGQWHQAALALANQIARENKVPLAEIETIPRSKGLRRRSQAAVERGDPERSEELLTRLLTTRDRIIDGLADSDTRLPKTKKK